ncbi:hypothetical protein MPL1032_180202 [Mesorhizobium plurifarium]|uniref:Uncharacterized protein n=1 Tax=Mesorhizobium plurifarium TaxID=69974 RepID=A0A0K2VTX1_MESPL|nr:hypothetical protein MPL1032_180202 [Mesorhizobium plurifarium]
MPAGTVRRPGHLGRVAPWRGICMPGQTTGQAIVGTFSGKQTSAWGETRRKWLCEFTSVEQSLGFQIENYLAPARLELVPVMIDRVPRVQGRYHRQGECNELMSCVDRGLLPQALASRRYKAQPPSTRSA